LGRKSITQAFPFLLPMRKAQRKCCFYLKMSLDKNRYAGIQAAGRLPYCAYSSSTSLYNSRTGFDMEYQENKVFNLRLAAEAIDGLLVRPQETFSFWQLVRKADQRRFKDGLSVEYGRLTTVKGGGLCHLSNFLFWMFLHTPLAITERHPHRVKDFPAPDASEPDGVDATVSEGWLDLKVGNQTDLTFQLDLSFGDGCLNGRIFTDQPLPGRYEIVNRDKTFFRRQGKVVERVSVCRQEFDDTGTVRSERLLYTDVFEIGYPLPEETKIAIMEEDSNEEKNSGGLVWRLLNRI
jgi:vancomycin resistance protein VanW